MKPTKYFERKSIYHVPLTIIICRVTSDVTSNTITEKLVRHGWVLEGLKVLGVISVPLKLNQVLIKHQSFRNKKRKEYDLSTVLA